MHWRGIVEEPRVTLGPCYDALWVALHAVAIATDFTSYRHTDPMYPPTLLPLLSTPAPWSFLQLQSKEKKAIWLKSKYFFFTSKNQNTRDSEQKARQYWNTLISQGSRGFRTSIPEGKAGDLPPPTSLSTSCSILPSLFPSWLHRSASPTPNTLPWQQCQAEF